jgi:hypothetical protein
MLPNHISVAEPITYLIGSSTRIRDGLIKALGNLKDCAIVFNFKQMHSTTLTHCKEDPISVFPEMKLRGLSPNFHRHVSLSDLYISTIGPPIYLQQNRQTDQGIYKSLTET